LPDDGGYLCLYGCQTTADCPAIDQRCLEGACVQSLCTDDDGPCEVDTGIPGTCVPATDYRGALVSVCYASGTETGACDPLGAVANGSCVAGEFCQSLGYNFDGGGFGASCTPLCDPQLDGGSCATGYCIFSDPFPGPGPFYTSPANPAFGLCESQAFCQNLEALHPCSAGNACPCGLSCASDPVTGANDCQHPCATSADCAQGTACAGSDAGPLCAPVPCPEPDGPCGYSAPGATDGTCDILFEAGQAVGFACAQAGSSDGGCDPSHGDRDCVPGSVCAGSSSGYGCTQLCNPTSGIPSCPPPHTCLQIGIDGATGFTQAADYGLCSTD
jgi:hypothetical protein